MALVTAPRAALGRNDIAFRATALPPTASGLGSPTPRRGGQDLALTALPLPVCSGGHAGGRLCHPSARGLRRPIPRLSRGPSLLGPSLLPPHAPGRLLPRGE